MSAPQRISLSSLGFTFGFLSGAMTFLWGSPWPFLGLFLVSLVVAWAFVENWEPKEPHCGCTQNHLDGPRSW